MKSLIINKNSHIREFHTKSMLLPLFELLYHICRLVMFLLNFTFLQWDLFNFKQDFSQNCPQMSKRFENLGHLVHLFRIRVRFVLNFSFTSFFCFCIPTRNLSFSTHVVVDLIEMGKYVTFCENEATWSISLTFSN